MTKQAMFMAFVVLLVGLAIAGCSGSRISGADGTAVDQTLNDAVGTIPAKAPEIPLEKGVSVHEGSHGSLYADPAEDNFWTWTMAFGQDWCAGKASLVMVDGEWCVVYELSDEALDAGYLFCDAHAHIWENEGDEPKGNPGQFDYKWDAGGNYDDFQDSVELCLGEDWTPPEGEFFLALHATICLWGIVGYDEETGDPIYGVINDETGWGSYCDTKNNEEPSWEGNWKKWGGWVSSTGVLPLFTPESRPYSASNPYGTMAYWRVVFNPDGNYPFYPFEANGNPWPGWCTDPTGFQNNVNSMMVSCYDPLLNGTYAESDHWDLISWMINERNDPSSPYYNYYFGYFQRAVWYFKYGNAGGMHLGSGGPGANFAATHPMVAALIADAKAYGEDYVPGPGEYYAVVLIPLDGNGDFAFGTSQVNIIEVDP